MWEGAQAVWNTMPSCDIARSFVLSYRAAKKIVEVRGHELMKDFPRGTYADWKDYLVGVAHDKVSKGGEDITSCLRETKDVKIDLDLSLKPTPAQHVDPTANAVTYDEIHPMMKDDWDKHVTKIEKRQAVYNRNKLTVCSIVKGSIDPHFKDKLRSKSEYEAKQDDLVWLLITLTLSCRSTYLVPIFRNFITLLPET